MLCGNHLRMQVSSIEGCFDRRSCRSTKVDSIENKSQFDRRQQVLRKCIELTIYQICLKIFPDTVNFGVEQNTFLNRVSKSNQFLNSVFQCKHVIANSSLSIEFELFCCWSGTPRKKHRQQKRSTENRVSVSHNDTAQELLLLSMRLQNCSFYDHLLFHPTDSCLWSNWLLVSIETTFDQNDLRLNWLATSS